MRQAREKLQGRTALVLGLAREGIDLARFLSRAGATVVLTDSKPAEALLPAMAQLDGLGVEYRLGNPTPAEALRGAEVVFASPGVPPENAILTAAREQGIRVTSLMELFFELCPAPIVGITGSAGKTTTTTLLGEIFRAAGRHTFVGGNIGKPLLGELGQITPESWVIVEMSSFQLESMRVSPHISVVTNVTPNHLDRHPTMEAYWEAKGHILAHQQPSDWVVVNADDAWSQRYQLKSQRLTFSLEHGADGWLDGDSLVVRGEHLVRVSEIRLPGRHNLANVLAAALAATAAGIDLPTIASTVRRFEGVAHRLQVVGEIGGVRYVNDSIATAPERSMAGIRAFDEPLVLIVGGRDKHLPMEEWAELIARRARHVVLLGEMSDLVRLALKAVGYDSFALAATMGEAVTLAASAARPGDVVLLSPGGTSYDMYQDFEERGRDFTDAVTKLEGR